MIIKKYIVKSVNEGLTRIKYELGKDAIIISQRKIRKPGLRGLFSKKVIELTAAVENPSNEVKDNYKQENNQTKVDEEFQNSLESIKRLMKDEVLSEKKLSKPKEIENSNIITNRILEHNANIEKEKFRSSFEKENFSKNSLTERTITKSEDFGQEKESVKLIKGNIGEEDRNLDTIHKEVIELKDLLNRVIKNSFNEEDPINCIRDKLIDLEIDDEFQDEIIQIVKQNSNGDIEEIEAIRDVLERHILVSRDVLNGRVVLVGPTGVGKTTTIAKLAGRLALVEKKKVGLITVDTYRIGAIEQLKTYAEIMNIPFEVVITMKEMEEAIESMKECDVVLIDTTGRSSKNAMQISELRAFVKKANPNHVSMVISATTKNSDIKSILKGYSELDYDNIIITKLDETNVYGSLYNIARIANKPVNFITIGQNVPDDIMIPTKEELASFILGEEILC